MERLSALSGARAVGVGVGVAVVGVDGIGRRGDTLSWATLEGGGFGGATFLGEVGSLSRAVGMGGGALRGELEMGAGACGILSELQSSNSNG